jgi:hypothetical protein
MDNYPFNFTFKVLRRAEELSRKGQQTGNYADILPGDWFPVVEAHDVFAAFENDPSLAVATTLKRTLSGPAQPIRENSKNRDGRNVWYELALAAGSCTFSALSKMRDELRVEFRVEYSLRSTA